MGRRVDLWQMQKSVHRIAAWAQQASYTVGTKGPFHVSQRQEREADNSHLAPGYK